MAYADELFGPWTVYTPGALKLEDSYFLATCPTCALLEISPSRLGYIDTPVNQLRDPAIYEAEGSVYQLYLVAGERGIALSRIKFF